MVKTPLTKYWVERYLEMLKPSLFVESFRKPDTRSRWKKFCHWIHHRTIFRFREWLHRDCGDF